MNTVSNFSLGRLAIKTIGIFIVMAILSTSLPQQTLASTIVSVTEEACASTHTVKSGEYLASIAKEYKVDWRDIADANDIKSPYVIYIGQKLCIPKESGSGSSGGSGSTAPTSNKASISVSKSKDTLTITTYNFPTKSYYYVRVDDARDRKFEWVKIGVLYTGKETSVKGSFKLPEELKNVSSLNLCLKNTATDARFCNNPDLNRGSTGSGSGSIAPATWKGTFTAKIVSKSIEIKTSKFPANSFFFVRLDNASNKTVEWYKAGILRVGKDGAVETSFNLPENLENATKLNVCLKNVVNDTVACKVVYR